MAGNCLNLITLTKGYLTGDFKNKLASLLGESREKTDTGLNVAIPGFLSGLDNTASTPDGARRLSTAVDNADEGMLTNLTSLFGMGNDIGTGPLQSLLGVGGFSELTGNIGRAAGLSGKTVSTLIGFLAPIIFAMFKKLKRARGLDAAGLATLLSSQRGNIAAAMHEATPEDTYGPRAVPHARMT